MWCSRDSAQVIRRSPLIGEGEIGYGVYLLLFEEALYCTLPLTVSLLDPRLDYLPTRQTDGQLCPRSWHLNCSPSCLSRLIVARRVSVSERLMRVPVSDRLVRTRQHWHIQ